MPFTVELIAAIVKIVLIIGFMLTTVPMLVWWERKWIADFQARIGPNRVGPFGILQSFADGIKLVTKENIMPTEVDKLLYLAAPVLVIVSALSVVAVIPFGGEVNLFGHTHKLVLADLPVGFLFVLALTSLGVYGIVLSGWSSNNKYSLLGALRSAAQMVSYELPMGLCVVAGLMIASSQVPYVPGQPGTNIFSLSLSKIVDTQAGWFFNWVAFNPRFLFLGFVAMVLFYICGLAETNRAPFDLPEAEQELVAGYLTEYGGLRWAMFFLGEYAAMLNVSAITTTLFLGGWHSPYPDTFLGVGSIPYAVHGMFWFGLKVFSIIGIYIWLRATLPRLRYDQLMNFTWKLLLPGTLLNVLIIGTILTIFFQEKPPAVLASTAAPGAVLPVGGTPGPGFVPPAPGVGNRPALNGPGAPPPGPAAPANAPVTSPAVDGSVVEPPGTPAANAPAANAPAANAPAAGGH